MTLRRYCASGDKWDKWAEDANFANPEGGDSQFLHRVLHPPSLSAVFAHHLLHKIMITDGHGDRFP
eukprot:4283161-Amphidinium_carterae.1